MTTFFTSDTHFCHDKVLKFEDRPFKEIHNMNDYLIEKWNSQVNEDDIVYHLGDFCLGTMEETVQILKHLKGKKVLIKGNHDYSKHWKKILKMGLLHDYHEFGTILKYQKQQLWLSHYPTEIGLRPRKWSIHGHIHSEPSTWDNQINVGIDSPHFKHKPFGELITIDELYEVMMERLPSIEERFLKRREETFITS